MGIINFLKGQAIDIIEFLDDSRDTLSHRFPDNDQEIKNGAQLIVRESQMAQFVYLGEFGDAFGPGKHTLTTDNIPILTTLKSWKYAFNSPFKADVYFVTTRVFTGNKWGTANPVMMRDADLGIVRARAYGTYDFRIIDAPKFLKEVAGTDEHFRLEEFSDVMRSRMVSVFSEALAKAKVPVLDVAMRYSELGEALMPVINPAFTEKYGLQMTSFVDRERFRSARGGTGHGQARQHGRGRQPQRLRQIPNGAGHGKGRRHRRGRHRRAKWRSACRSRATHDAARRLHATSRRRRRGRRGSAHRGRVARVAHPGTGCPIAWRHRGRCHVEPRVRRPEGQEDRHVLARHAQGAGRFPQELK